MNIDLFCFFYKILLMLDIIIVVDKNMLFKELSIGLLLLIDMCIIYLCF